MPEKIHYVAECTAEGCLAEFHVNDFPVVRCGVGEGYYYGMPVSELVVSGVNVLTVVIGPGERPGTALTGDGETRGRSEPAEGAFARLRLTEAPDGAMIGGPDSREMAVMEWRPEGGGEVTLPLVRSTTVEIASPFGTWTWEELPRITLDETALAELREFVTNLHLAVDSGMPEPYFEACEIRFADIERAHHLEGGDRADVAKQIFTTLMESDSWALVPLDELEWDPRPVAEERLIELIATDGQALLRQVPNEDGQAAMLDMRVGRVDGEWKVVR